MSSNHSAKEFIRGCREQFVMCPGIKERRDRELLYRQFSGYPEEFSVLYSVINEQLNDSQLIRRIINAIEISGHGYQDELADYLQNLRQLITSYAIEEESQEGCFTQFNKWLGSYCRIVSGFRVLIEEDFLVELKSILASTSKLEGSYCTRLENIFNKHCKIEFYLGSIKEYRDQFIALRNNEQYETEGLIVYSKLGMHFHRLIELTDRLVYSVNLLLDQIKYWKDLLSRIEKQQICN